MGYLRNVGRALVGKSPITGETINALLGQAITGRIGSNYKSLASNGFAESSPAYRAITDITNGVASIPVTIMNGDEEIEDPQHEVTRLLTRPNPKQSRFAFVQEAMAYFMIDGNIFIDPISVSDLPNASPQQLFNLRPDYVTIERFREGTVGATRYTYEPTGSSTDKKVWVVSDIDTITSIMHSMTFNPISDIRGLSQLFSARSGLERHLLAEEWNSNLIRNGAKPPGVFSVKQDNEAVSTLEPDVRERVLEQIRAAMTGPSNAGNSPLIEGGLEWKQMGLSPVDMDWMNGKHSAARDICNSLNYPSMLLGIPGDNTYATMREARAALWENKIVPDTLRFWEDMTRFLAPRFPGITLILKPNFDGVTALMLRQEQLWDRVKATEWLSTNEKRDATGYEPKDLPEAEEILVSSSMVPLSLGDIPEDVSVADPATPTVQPTPTGGFDETQAITSSAVLNGAQVTAIVELMNEVAAGNLTRRNVIALMGVAFGIDEATANIILPEEGSNPAAVPEPASGNGQSALERWVTRHASCIPRAGMMQILKVYGSGNLSKTT